MKLRKYYVIFVYILQDKMLKTQNTNNQKRKVWEYESKHNQKSILHLY